MAHVASTRGLGPHLRPTPTLRGGPRQGPAHVILAHGGQGRRATAVACGQCLGPVGVSSRHSSMKEGVKCASAEASRDECRHGTKGGDSNVVDERNEEGADVSVPDSARDAQPTPAVSAAMGLLRFYKSQISPLLPPSCRYIPTCSGEVVSLCSRSLRSPG